MKIHQPKYIMTKLNKNQQGLSKLLWIVIIAAFILVVGAGTLFFLYQNQKTDQNSNQNSNLNNNQNRNYNTNTAVTNQNQNTNTTVIQNTNTVININSNTNTAVSDPDTKTKNELRNLAMNFAEVWGSYSNQSDFENITDLKTLMTSKMSEWADSYQKNAKKNQPTSQIYYGITTKAISTALNSFNDSKGQAEFTVTCQRQESTGTVANSKIFYQDIIINFAKESKVWKVAGAYWQ